MLRHHGPVPRPELVRVRGAPELAAFESWHLEGLVRDTVLLKGLQCSFVKWSLQKVDESGDVGSDRITALSPRDDKLLIAAYRSVWTLLV